MYEYRIIGIIGDMEYEIFRTVDLDLAECKFDKMQAVQDRINCYEYLEIERREVGEWREF